MNVRNTVFATSLRLLAASALGAASMAWAQVAPAPPYRYVVGAGAGSASDIVARQIAEALGQEFGRQVIVDNRTGTSGVNASAELVAKAPPDGQTLLQTAFSHAVAVSLFRKLSYDIVRDFATVSLMATSPNLIVVHPSLPVKSVGEFVKLAKAKPGAINVASAGTGTGTHLAAEMFKGLAGINFVHVPYRGGGEAITAVVSGEVPVYFAPYPTLLPHIKQGRLRVLAVTTAGRLPMLPQTPTVAESGFRGYEAGAWYGLMVPVKTPRETVTMLNTAAVAALKKPDITRRFNDMGYIIIASRPDEFAGFLKTEIDKLGKVIRQAGIAVN